MIQIGGFKFDLKDGDKYEILRLFKCYTSDEGNPDCVVELTPEDLIYEKRYNPITQLDTVLAYNAFFRKFAEWLPLNDAALIHGVLIDVENTGVLFSALSGTGKTTHMLLWQKLLGDRLTIVNGDKPMVRFIDGKPMAFGTPWKGKENLGKNLNVSLKHICFITRAEQNSVKSLSKEQALNRLMTQVYMPQNTMAVAATLQICDKLLNSVKIWEICCNMDIESAQVAYETIFHGK